VRDFTYHRGVSHAYFFQTLAATPLALGLRRLFRDRDGPLGLWTLAVWLCLVTHATLDAFTVYGTQLWLPISNRPVAWSTLFIIDPLYTLPLLVGIGAALALRGRAARLASGLGLAAATAYLGWSVGAKLAVERTVEAELERAGLGGAARLTVPTPFNTLLWRVVVREPGAYYEGFHALTDPPETGLGLTRHPVDDALFEAVEEAWAAERLAWFTRGFYDIEQSGDAIVITDLRMGQEPWYVFRFALPRNGGQVRQLPGGERPAGGLAWIVARLAEPDLPPLSLRRTAAER
jgi:inner membrane protein